MGRAGRSGRSQSGWWSRHVLAGSVWSGRVGCWRSWSGSRVEAAEVVVVVVGPAGVAVDRHQLTAAAWPCDQRGRQHLGVTDTGDLHVLHGAVIRDGLLDGEYGRGVDVEDEAGLGDAQDAGGRIGGERAQQGDQIGDGHRILQGGEATVGCREQRRCDHDQCDHDTNQPKAACADRRVLSRVDAVTTSRLGAADSGRRPGRWTTAGR
jgi:hypothetical protein